MSEYICKEDLIKAIENDCPNLVYYSKKEAIECIEAMDAADVEPVIHAKWINHGSFVECSHCHEEQYGVDNFRLYCAHCKAKMDLE